MADPLRTLLGGFIEKIPADTPPTLRLGFVFWRITVVMLPLLSLAGAIAVQTTGEEIATAGQEMMSEPLLILLTFGLVLVIGALFVALGSAFMAVGAVLFLMAPVLFFLLAWSLGRVLRGESAGTAAAGWTMGGAIVLGLFFGTVPGTVVAGALDAPALALPFTFVAVVAPVLGLILVLQRESRVWLQSHAARARPAVTTA